MNYSYLDVKFLISLESIFLILIYNKLIFGVKLKFVYDLDDINLL
jgi:hypothetical protein